jgi:predicted transcriptional regulator
MPETLGATEILGLTTNIVVSYLSRNHLEADALPTLLRAVWGTLTTLEAGDDKGLAPAPAVPPNKSVFPDYIICLEDGKKLTMLKRHLMTTYSLTPEQYRAKWSLPANYPLVAPNYAKKRSDLAKQSGLGHRQHKKAISKPTTRQARSAKKKV